MRYLLDTCIIEALLKEEAGHENIRARIAAAPRGSLAISALTAVEIFTGITDAREPRAKRIAFEGWLKVMRVAAFDAAAARQAFMIQHHLRQTGQQIGRTDPMIAAQAIAAKKESGVNITAKRALWGLGQVRCGRIDPPI